MFKDDLYFLNTMAKSDITVNNITYPTLEHAFQAMKTTDPEIQAHIASIESPVDAKRFGRDLDARPDWTTIRLDVMRRLLEIKFGKSTMKRLLLKTGDVPLVNTNTYGDTFWGVNDQTEQGQNWLGRLLEEVRDLVNNQDGWLYCDPQQLYQTH